uniref:Uncharacterized protein n=1 Tax=Anguilla anguilla TaxID=7936 RepID=A0A0E9R8S1_ANGAN
MEAVKCYPFSTGTSMLSKCQLSTGKKRLLHGQMCLWEKYASTKIK